MYQQFYGFAERPFSLLPDPDFLYLSAKHRTALDTLELAVCNRSGFCVISGEIGAGKTTLVRELLNRLDSSICVGLVSNTHPAFGSLLQWVASAFGMRLEDSDALDLHRRFIEFVIAQYARQRHTLLIIDEAQNLSPAALEELRMLSNINSDKDFVLQIMLVGQPQLRDKLRDPALRQFAQRIALDYHLQAMTEAETEGYIRHRLQHAGGSAQLFSRAACLAVARHSGGIPRLINRLCDLALVYGCSEQEAQIDAAVIERVVADGHLGPLSGVELPAKVAAPVQVETAAAGGASGPAGPAPASSGPQPATEPRSAAATSRADNGPQADPTVNPARPTSPAVERKPPAATEPPPSAAATSPRQSADSRGLEPGSPATAAPPRAAAPKSAPAATPERTPAEAKPGQPAAGSTAPRQTADKPVREEPGQARAGSSGKAKAEAARKPAVPAADNAAPRQTADKPVREEPGQARAGSSGKAKAEAVRKPAGPAADSTALRQTADKPAGEKPGQARAGSSGKAKAETARKPAEDRRRRAVKVAEQPPAGPQPASADNALHRLIVDNLQQPLAAGHGPGRGAMWGLVLVLIIAVGGLGWMTRERWLEDARYELQHYAAVAGLAGHELLEVMLSTPDHPAIGTAPQQPPVSAGRPTPYSPATQLAFPPRLSVPLLTDMMPAAGDPQPTDRPLEEPTAAPFQPAAGQATDRRGDEPTGESNDTPAREPAGEPIDGQFDEPAVPDAGALQQETAKLAEIQARTEQLERQRREAESRLAEQRAARQAAEQQARIEQLRLQAARESAERQARIELLRLQSARDDARRAAAARIATERQLLEVERQAGVAAPAAVEAASPVRRQEPVATQRHQSTREQPDDAGAASEAEVARSGGDQVRFSVDPCKGPTARFLSTCR